MTPFESTLTLTPPITIDQTFLLRKVSGLAQVRQKHRTWDEHGERLTQNFCRLAGHATEAFTWSQAKELVYQVLTRRDPRHDAIRKCLGNLKQPSTPRLLSTLGLWLAGVLQISVTATMPMVGVILYGLGEAEGQWPELGAGAEGEGFLDDFAI
jgi:hypothetical protein